MAWGLALKVQVLRVDSLVLALTTSLLEVYPVLMQSTGRGLPVDLLPDRNKQPAHRQTIRRHYAQLAENITLNKVDLSGIAAAEPITAQHSPYAQNVMLLRVLDHVTNEQFENCLRRMPGLLKYTTDFHQGQQQSAIFSVQFQRQVPGMGEDGEFGRGTPPNFSVVIDYKGYR